jgi:hypothetical protein
VASVANLERSHFFSCLYGKSKEDYEKSSAGICLAPTALFSHQPGATPQDFRLYTERALKARLNAPMKRAFSADALHRWSSLGAAQG